jgi:16S rRNA (uracil1498-N3)-methyltransferase
MRPRFFVPDLDPDQEYAVLPHDEAHHLTRVLRLEAGDQVSVFDGRGREFLGRVASTARGHVTVSVLEPIAAVPAPAVALTLVQAVLKPDAMDQVVRDATMAGVEAIQPVAGGRTTVKSALLPKGLDRWRRIALASAKQCGRSTLPILKEPVPFMAWVEARGDAPAFLLTEPSIATNAVTIRQLAARPIPAAASLVIGPEGGWTAEEHAAALERGCVPLTLGRLTLRADAAALAAIAALLGIWDE